MVNKCLPSLKIPNLKRQGFTLLELLLVLAIMGLASAVLIPRLNSDVKLFDAQVRELVAILKYSRRMAIVNNRVQRVTLLPHIDRQLGEQQKSSPQSDKNKAISKKNTPWQSRGAQYLWTAVNTRAEIKNKKLIIDFFPQGGATEGELILYHKKLKTLIKIDGFTGRVSIESLE